MNYKITFAIAACLGLFLFASPGARSEPMKCSGEQKTCNAKCVGLSGALASNCAETCRAIHKACIRTGCWDTGRSRYCGLMKQ